MFRLDLREINANRSVLNIQTDDTAIFPVVDDKVFCNLARLHTSTLS